MSPIVEFSIRHCRGWLDKRARVMNFRPSIYELHRGRSGNALGCEIGEVHNAVKYIRAVDLSLYWIKYNSASTASYKNKYRLMVDSEGHRITETYNIIKSNEIIAEKTPKKKI